MGQLESDIDLIAGSCIAVRLRMLNRAVTNLYDEALRPLDMKVSQMNLLVVTGKMGVARPAAVCEWLKLDASTLSRNVDRMTARGWLEVVPDEDGRAQPFRLTTAGRQLLKKAVPQWQAAQQKATQMLGAAGVQAIAVASQQIPSV